MAPVPHDAVPSAPPAPRWRWYGLAAGVLTGMLDMWSMSLLGVTFEINGWDARLLVGSYFGLSFAVLGFLLGAAVESRRRDRDNAAVMQAQMEAINGARARLVQSEKLAALGQLAATIAHEVRNPLAVMRSAAQTLADDAAGGGNDVRQASTFIMAEIDRLANVVNSLLAFARPLQLAVRPVQVAAVVERALLLARDELGAKRVRVRCGDLSALPPVDADADLISQVLLGLLSNAAEAVPDGGDVAVSAAAAGAAVHISVADSGPGIAPELRTRVFEPFYTTRPRGTGLGLAIARHIVEAHGGRIEVDAAPTAGARFTITLPASGRNALAA